MATRRRGPAIPSTEGTGDVAGFCPACLRWALPMPSQDDGQGIRCAKCGARDLERFVTLLARAVVVAPRTGSPRAVGIGLSDQLVAALAVARIEVLRLATDWSREPRPDMPRGVLSPPEASASLAVWVTVAASAPDISRRPTEIARMLSRDAVAIVALDPAPEGMEAAFGDAGFVAQRVAAGHVLPTPALRLTGIDARTAAWSFSLLPREARATTAELSARVEGQLLSAIGVAGTYLEAKVDHLEAVASEWERAYTRTRQRRAVRAADAVRSLGRRLAGRPLPRSGVRLPVEPPPATVDTLAGGWIVNEGATSAPPHATPAVQELPINEIPAVSPRADALMRCRLGAGAPRLRLVLDEFNDDRVFAGISTALNAAVALARTVDLPLTVMLLREPADRRSIGTLIDWFRTGISDQHFVDDIQVTIMERDPDQEVHADDVWMLTYWTTAVATGRAVRAGIVDPRRAVYLVQDYEPGFFGWSDEAAMAATTYREGFHHVVNSRPLARFLADEGGVSVPPEHVFAPVVNVDLLERAAAAWRPDPEGRLRLLFYGRPHHPRNLFRIGLESLRLWMDTLADDERPLLRSAGADHPPYRIAGDLYLEPLGKLSFERYVELLSRTDLTLALMFSPHPGHLSLESPAAGIPTVTNSFGSYRESWLAGLSLADPEPHALARALAEGARSARGLEAHHAQRLPATLGVPLDDAIRAVASRL